MKRARTGMWILVAAAVVLSACQSRCARPRPGVEQFAYDRSGRLARWTTPNGDAVAYEYDTAGRVVRVRTGSAPDVTFSYNAAGDLVNARNSGGATELARDAFGHLSKLTAPNGKALSYEYDPWGRVASISVAGGSQVKFSYDLLGRLLIVDDGEGRVTYEYRDDEVLRRLPSGIVTIYTLSKSDVASIVHRAADGAVLVAFEYSYRPDGKVREVTERSPRGTSSERYDYDLMGRLVLVERSNGERVSYTYDAVGNRTSETIGDRVVRYEYDKLGRLVKKGDDVLSYDAAGSLIAWRNAQGKVIKGYKYDTQGRLVSVEGPQKVRYSYDGLNNRVARQVGSKVSHYLNDISSGLAQPIAVYDRTGRLEAQYFFGESRLGERDATGATRHYLTDRLGSIRYIVNSQGGTVAERRYDTFGQPLADDGAPADGELAGFGGELWDQNAGLTFLRARYYAPSLGRFVSPDFYRGSFVAPRSLNRYVYASGDPVNRRDPLGLQDSASSGLSFTPPSVSAGTGGGGSVIWGSGGDFVGGTNPVPQSAPSLVSQVQIATSSLIQAPGRTAGFFNDAIESMAQAIAPVAGESLARLAAPAMPLVAANRSFRAWVHADPIGAAITTGKIGVAGASIAASFGLLSAPTAALVAEFASPAKTALDTMSFARHDPTGAEAAKKIFGVSAKVLGIEDIVSPAYDIKKIFTFKPENPATSAVTFPAPVIHLPPDDAWYQRVHQEFLAKQASLPTSGLSPQVGAVTEPPVGGVRLGRAATIIGQLGSITGATYDAKSGRLVLIGQKGSSLPPMRLDDLAVALRASYFDAQGASMTIDPDPRNPLGPTMNVAYFGQTEQTHFGWVMFEADRVMKTYSVGRDNITNAEINLPIQGYCSTGRLRLLRFGVGAGACEPSEQLPPLPRGANGPQLWSRFWLIPDRVVLSVSRDGSSIVFDEAKMRVCTETMRLVGGKLIPANPRPEHSSEHCVPENEKVIRDEPAEYFAKHFTDHYEEYARQNPIYGQLKRLAQVTAVATWMKQAGVPLDGGLIEALGIPAYDTPGVTPSATNTVKVVRKDGRTTFTEQVYSFGGSVLRVRPGYPEKRSSRADAVGMAARKALETNAGTVTVDGRDQAAVVLQTAVRPDHGSFRTSSIDATASGGAALSLRRSYTSFHTAPTSLGFGWTFLVPRLAFAPVIDQYDRSGHVSVAGRPDTSVLVQRFRMSDDFGSVDEEFREDFIDQERVRIGFKPAHASSPYAALYPNGDGTFSILLKSGAEWRFDGRGSLAAVRNGSAVITYRYEPNSARPVEIASGRAWIRLRYDEKGRVRAVLSSDGDQVAYSYDANGDLAGATNNGRSIEYRYDSDHQLVQEVAAGVPGVRNVYDQGGRLLKQVAQTGSSTVFEQKVGVDKSGRRRITRTVNGASTTVLYDENLRPVEAQNGPASSVYAYHANGSMKSIISVGADKSKVEIHADEAGRNIRAIDLRGTEIELRSDQQGYVQQVLINRKGAATYGRDELGRVVSIDYGTHKEQYVYDQLGRVAAYSVDSPSGGPTRQELRLSYDANGNLVGATGTGFGTIASAPAGAQSAVLRAAGKTLKTTLDPQGRVAEIIGAGNDTVQFAYDGGAAGGTVVFRSGSQTGRLVFREGRIVESTDLAGATTKYEYNASGRLVAVVDAYNGRTQYTYDHSGRLATVKPPAGPQTRYMYSASGNLTEVVDE